MKCKNCENGEDHLLVLSFTLNLDHFREHDLKAFIDRLTERIREARTAVENGTFHEREGKLIVDRPKGH